MTRARQITSTFTSWCALPTETTTARTCSANIFSSTRIAGEGSGYRYGPAKKHLGSVNVSRTNPGSESQSDAADPKRDVIAGLRRFLLAVFFVGLLGTGTDLIILEHFEDKLQFIPLILLGLAIIVIAWHVIDRGRASGWALRMFMLLFLIAGILGLVLHYRGSMAFQLEVNPDLAGLELFLKTIRAKAPPALGPAGMIYLGLLGLAYAYRYPYGAVRSDRQQDTRRT